jgi:hypothetical protein
MFRRDISLPSSGCNNKTSKTQGGQQNGIPLKRPLTFNVYVVISRKASNFIMFEWGLTPYNVRIPQIQRSHAFNFPRNWTGILCSHFGLKFPAETSFSDTCPDENWSRGCGRFAVSDMSTRSAAIPRRWGGGTILSDTSGNTVYSRI